MFGARRVLTTAVVTGVMVLAVGTAALVVPTTSVASCASCQQYTDPFGSTTTTRSAPPPAQTTTTSAPTPTTSAPDPTTSAPDPTTDTETPAATASATATSSDPTATAASSSTTASTGTGKSLPYSGYDAWAVAGFGLVLVAGGLVARRHAARS